MTNVTIDTVTMPLEAARSVEWAGVNVAEDLRALRAGETTHEQLLAECLDGAEPEHEGDWREYVSAVSAAAEAEQAAPACESGEATGEPCCWDGEPDELVTVEWMPEYLRESHRAAGGWGSYPHNGAQRLRCCPACAEMLQADEGEEEGEEPITVEVRHAQHAAVGDTIGGNDGNAWRIIQYVSPTRAQIVLGEWSDVADDDAERGCTPRAMVEVSS